MARSFLYRRLLDRVTVPMATTNPTLLSALCVVLTTILHMPSAAAALRMPFGSQLANMLAAKRGAAHRGPRDDRLPEVTFATRHEDVQLDCVFQGNPTVHWLKDGIRLQQGFARDVSDDEPVYEEKQQMLEGQTLLKIGKVRSRLYLNCVTSRDEAVYSCVADTPFGRMSQNTTLKMSNSLSLQSKASCLTKKAVRGEPARIYLWTVNRLEWQGATVQLYCRAGGYPIPTCNWLKLRGGDEESQWDRVRNDDQYQLLPNGDLLINSITWDTKSYMCSCSNDAGTDEVETFIYATF